MAFSADRLSVQPAETAPAGRPSIGKRLKLTATDMALEGDAIVRAGQYILFVSGAIPGEEVEVQVESAGRKHGRARLLSVLKPSPHRVAPPCPYFGPCGGCAWQHIAYPEQLRLKEKLLGSALELALDMRPPVGPAISLEDPWGFRNKLHFVVGPDREGRLALGHYGVRSRELIPVEECRVHSEKGNQVAFRLRDLLRQHRVPPVKGDHLGTGVARHVLARASERTGEVQAVLVATRRKFPGLEEIAREITSAGASGFHLNTNRREGPLVLGSFTRRLAGRERLLEEVAGVKFFVSPVSFFQTSSRAAEKLVETVIAGVPSDSRERVLDLYAGAGLFALPLARRGHQVLAVEENPYAIEDGIETARHNRIHGCRFVRARVEGAVRRLGSRGEFGTVILDPPRDGASERVLWGLAQNLRPRRILYVSCDPRALGRDLRVLLGAGYQLEEVRPVDMFPHTAHIESVARLSLVERRPFEGGRGGAGRREGVDGRGDRGRTLGDGKGAGGRKGARGRNGNRFKSKRRRQP